jgi:hypothetical protein
MMMAARKGRAAARQDVAQDRRAAHESAYWHLTDVGILANFRFAPTPDLPLPALLTQNGQRIQISVAERAHNLL